MAANSPSVPIEFITSICPCSLSPIVAPALIICPIQFDGRLIRKPPGPGQGDDNIHAQGRAPGQGGGCNPAISDFCGPSGQETFGNPGVCQKNAQEPPFNFPKEEAHSNCHVRTDGIGN